MNLYIVCRRYCPGEAWTNRVLAYAKGLALSGCTITLMYIITDSRRNPYSINIPGVNVKNLWEDDGVIARRFRQVSLIKNLWCLRKTIKKNDIVFIYGTESYILTPLLTTGARIFCEVTEHPYIYNRNGKSGEYKIDRKLRNLNRLSGLFVISKQLKDYFTSIGISENKIEISNMFVDTTRFSDIQRIGGCKYVAYCGVISFNKDGVDTLIRSFAIFHKSHPEYKLKLIGRVRSQEEKDKLTKLAINLLVDKHVEFTGQVSPSEIPVLLTNASILALARPNNLQAQNGFPTKLGEYLATSNPVVVTRVGEIPNFIDDRVNGFLADPDDPDDFAKQLSWVADNYEEACRIGKNGQKLSETEFSYITQSEKVLLHIKKNIK